MSNAEPDGEHVAADASKQADPGRNLNRTKNKQAAAENPHEFASVAAGIIKEKLTDQLVDGIQYEKVGDWYEMSQFETELKPGLSIW